jgi:hypothetical protein
MWRWLVSPRPLTRAELIGCFALLTVLAAVVFGSHVVHGGFLMDDWSNAAKSRYLASCCGLGETGQGIGWSAQYRNMLSDGPAGYHLGLPVVVPVAYFLFGIHMSLHLALAVMLGVAMSAAAYALLRGFGLRPLHAGVIAALVLLYPFSDSTRLWAMAGYNQILVLLWVAGLAVALRGLRERGRRAAAFHAGALALYLAAILMYELAAGLVSISVVFYLFRGTWRQALVRWGPDLAVAAGGLLYVKAQALPRVVVPFDAGVDHAGRIADQAVTLLATSALPYGTPSRIVLVGLMAAAFVAGAVALRGLAPGDELRTELRRWLAVAAGGVAVVIGGYATIVPANYGAPLDAGIENRVNMISAFGYVAIAYAAAVIGGRLLARGLGRPRLELALPLGLAALIAIGYVVHLDRDKRYYDSAFQQGQVVIDSIRRAMPSGKPPRESMTYVFGTETFVAPGVPVFAWIWDMPGALKVSFQDSSIAGYAMLPGTTFACDDDLMFPQSGYGLGKSQGAEYGQGWFVDVAAGTAERIDTEAECQRERDRFRPGPLKAGADCGLVGGGPATRLAWHCASKPPGS